jgi:hypothetical protein
MHGKEASLAVTTAATICVLGGCSIYLLSRESTDTTIQGASPPDSDRTSEESSSEGISLTPMPPSDFPEGMDCAFINSPTAGEFNDTNPVIKNAYRAVLAAGDPETLEVPPYYYTPGAIGKKHGREDKTKKIQNLADLRLVYNGDKICVEEFSGRGFHPGGPIFEAYKYQNNRLAHASVDIRANIRLKQGF